MTTENRILQLLAEGRLVRDTWASTDIHGRQLLCLLTALTGNPDTRPESCPADVAPAWVAHLMPWWDDSGSADRWPGLMRQIGELSPRFGELYGATGRRALAGCQLVSLRVELRHAGDEAAPVVERVISLWERVLCDDEPADDEWRAAREEAAAAGSAATSWAAAAEAAEAASWAAARAAAAARLAAAREAAAMGSAATSRAAAAEAAEAARAAADEIIRGHINAIKEALA